jgi:hypothetical protein
VYAMYVLLNTPRQSNLLRHVHHTQARRGLRTLPHRSSTLSALLVAGTDTERVLCARDGDVPHRAISRRTLRGPTSIIIAVGVLLLWTLGCTFACLVAVYPREG